MHKLITLSQVALLGDHGVASEYLVVYISWL